MMSPAPTKPLRVLLFEEAHHDDPPQTKAFERLYSSLQEAQQVEYVWIVSTGNTDMMNTTQHFIEERGVNTIFVDLFSVHTHLGIDYGVWKMVRFIFQVRERFPSVVFVLYIDFDKLSHFEKELYTGEGRRFAHYYKLNQRLVGEEYTIAVDKVLNLCVSWVDNYKKYARGLYEYDVALSFAGEDRPYAEKLARCLHRHKVRVFYDTYEQARLWGLDLFLFLHEIYAKKAQYCVIFISSSYVTKMWTTHERKSAQGRALRERENEYILPIKVDDEELPGLPSTIAYLNVSIGIPNICKMLLKKLEMID